jgi:hypothetical protein
VLLGTPLHASSNFTVSVQLADKRGFIKKKKKKKKMSLKKCIVPPLSLHFTTVSGILLRAHLLM